MENLKLNLSEIRDSISEVDEEIVQLLEKRFNLTLKVGQYKKNNNIPIFDDEREKIVIEKCMDMLEDSKFGNYLQKIYEEIMNNCKEIQKNEI
ncbi:MAG: chorismate mutase [Bacillota bacterium]|jgi:monofunctional chorismate mutase|nr:chorismate mutase [Bacillota bacterium]